MPTGDFPIAGLLFLTRFFCIVCNNTDAARTFWWDCIAMLTSSYVNPCLSIIYGCTSHEVAAPSMKRSSELSPTEAAILMLLCIAGLGLYTRRPGVATYGDPGRVASPMMEKIHHRNDDLVCDAASVNMTKTVTSGIFSVDTLVELCACQRYRRGPEFKGSFRGLVIPVDVGSHHNKKDLKLVLSMNRGPR